jgi:hypothetical protein
VRSDSTRLTAEVHDAAVRLDRRVDIVTRGGFAVSAAFSEVEAEVTRAVAAVRWPAGASIFTIRPERNGNGVRPIRDAFTAALTSAGWKTETAFMRGANPAERLPGEFDAHRDLSTFGCKPFVVEWETGNISSSHRALNKMALAMLRGHLSGGILVLPTRALYQYLTDRVGNIDEITPYFELWNTLQISDCYLGVIAVEYDATSDDVALIPKGTDGRARG